MGFNSAFKGLSSSQYNSRSSLRAIATLT